jgi:hypothetical protein
MSGEELITARINEEERAKQKIKFKVRAIAQAPTVTIDNEERRGLADCNLNLPDQTIPHSSEPSQRYPADVASPEAIE